jgi:hypothetical protein
MVRGDRILERQKAIDKATLLRRNVGPAAARMCGLFVPVLNRQQDLQSRRNNA